MIKNKEDWHALVIGSRTLNLCGHIHICLKILRYLSQDIKSYTYLSQDIMYMTTLFVYVYDYII